MSDFESGKRKVIPAVLVYLRCGDRILMLHRNARDRPGDYHAGKWNGVGGKMEPDESSSQAAVREVEEETGILISESQLVPLGVLHFPNFKAHRQEDWWVTVFTVDLPSKDFPEESFPKKCPEGDLHWIPSNELLNLNLWPGDRHFIPYVQSGTPFIGTLWYRGNEVLRHSLTPLERRGR